METVTKIIKAHKLRDLACEYVERNFNYIQVDVLKAVAGDDLFEYIRQEEPDYLEFINNYGLHSEFKKEYNKEAEEAASEALEQFCEKEAGFDDYLHEEQSENYPMWNTCFEFRHEPSEREIEAAINAGFGVIEGLGNFNTILFVAGCGYSFYAGHWIPLYLSLPYNEDKRKEFKNVNYEGM